MENNDEDRLGTILHGGTFQLFFSHEGRVYGTDEAGRISFCRLRSPDEDDVVGTKYEFFRADDLVAILSGERRQKMFGTNEIGELEVIPEPDDVKQLLAKNKGL